jgi:hypothetical protein
MLWDDMTTANGTTLDVGAADRPGMMNPWRRCGLLLLCWLLAITLGAARAWAARHMVNADGLSYLDLADAWREGRWHDAINAYWSPGYSWLLAIALELVHTSPYWEAAAAHLVNLLGYLLALATFHYFWMGLFRHIESWWQSSDLRERLCFPEWAWITVGYALCVWLLLDYIGLNILTPDVYVAAFIFLDVGLIVRIRSNRAGWGLFLILGISLGLGYLTKAILLPMASMFIVTTLLAAPRLLWVIPRLMLTVAVCVALGGPWVWAMTEQKGRFTTGDTGKLSFAFHINGFQPWDVWQGEPAPRGLRVSPASSPAERNPDQTPQGTHSCRAKHPARWVLEKPAVFEFATPIPGTYPLWYDPSYWHEGAQPYFSPRQQLQVLTQQLGVYFNLLCKDQGMIAIILLSLLLVRGEWTRITREALSMWWVALPVLAGLGAYALIRVESRYIAPFLIPLWAVILLLVRLPRSDAYNRLINCSATAILIGLLSMIGYSSVTACKEAAGDAWRRKESTRHQDWVTAQEMLKAGLKPGDQVGHIGQGLRGWSYWARLAGVRITAEVRPEESFWLADDAARTRVLDAFANLDTHDKTGSKGVRAIVARREPPNERLFGLPYDFAPGWQRVPNTRFHIRFLNQPTSAPASRPGS